MDKSFECSVLVLHKKGLAGWANVVGKPLGANALTSKLEMIMFARMQVLYKMGDPFPNISSVIIHLITDQKFVVKVSVSLVPSVLYLY